MVGSVEFISSHLKNVQRHTTLGNPTAFARLHRIQVFSTNYRRTQLSAQGFLDGFRGGIGGVPIVVRPRGEDILNQWESQGHDMYGVRGGNGNKYIRSIYRDLVGGFMENLLEC